MEVERMGHRRQPEHQINVRNDQEDGIRDHQLIRATWPGCNTKASAAGRSASETQADTRGVRRDTGGPQGPEQDPECEKCPSAP